MSLPDCFPLDLQRARPYEPEAYQPFDLPNGGRGGDYVFSPVDGSRENSSRCTCSTTCPEHGRRRER